MVLRIKPRTFYTELHLQSFLIFIFILRQSVIKFLRLGSNVFLQTQPPRILGIGACTLLSNFILNLGCVLLSGKIPHWYKAG